MTVSCPTESFARRIKVKIFYLLKKKHDETLDAIMAAHRSSNEVTEIDLGQDKDYEKIVDRIAESDLVISW